MLSEGFLIGGEKFIFATSAWLSFNRYTAASSEVSVPTSSSFGRPRIGVEARISVSTAGAILQPQPPPGLYSGRRIFSGAFTAAMLSDGRAKIPADEGAIELGRHAAEFDSALIGW